MAPETQEQKQKGKSEADSRSEAASLGRRQRNVPEQFPWERWEGETAQAYRAFVLYRSQDPKTRSFDRCGVGHTMARRWAARFRWVTRTVEWEAFLAANQAELSELGKLNVRSAQLRFSKLALDKAAASVANLDETKQNVEDIVALAESATKLGREAVGLNVGRAESESSGLSISLPSVPWLAAFAPQTKQSETKVVVDSGEKVLGETPAIPTRTRLVHRVMDCPSDNGSLPSAAPLESPSPVVESGPPKAGTIPVKRTVEAPIRPKDAK